MGFLSKSAICVAVISFLCATVPYIYKQMDQREFGRMTTAEEASKGNEFRNKVAIVTGSSSGIGISTAKVLYENGATVIMACRNVQKTEKVRNDILQQIKDENPLKSQKLSEKKLKIIELDLGSLKSVYSFSQTFLLGHDKLNILINNAGVMGNDHFGLTVDGIEQQFGINVVGHFYLTQLLTPLLIKSAKNNGIISRVINVASVAYRGAPSNLAELMDIHKINNKNEYSPMQRYGLTKASNIIFASEYNERYRNKGVYSISLHPGSIKTGLQDYNYWLNFFKYVPSYLIKTQSEGAATSIRLAAMSDDEFIANSGSYFEDCNKASLWRKDILDDSDSKKLGKLLWSLCETIIKSGLKRIEDINLT